MTPHNLAGSFYTLEYGMDAKLLLNNKGNTPLEVQPTLYNSQGQEMQIPAVSVEPQSFRFINLRDWASLGGDSFRSGSIKLFHVGKDLVLGAQIYLTDEARSLSFEEKLTELGKFDSRRLEAVWVMPTQQTEARVIFTNTKNAPLSLTARLARNPNQVASPQTFQLAAHETKILNLRQDFVEGNRFAGSSVVGLSLEHTGVKDALLARVLVDEAAKGYSNVVQFSNPNGGKSSEYQGVGFQVEDVNNMPLTPVIVARNVGASATHITVRVPYTRADGTRGTINLPRKRLAAGELGLINTHNIMMRVRHEQIKVASLEFNYDTAPGSVIAAAHSASSDGNQVFRVPMWDPLVQRSPTGGYPWRIEGTSVTETYIKNITDVEENYVAFLLWENGGIYMMGLRGIAPHETVHIDIRKLRDEQIPDEHGRTIPPSVSNGQFQWSLRRIDTLADDDARANLALIGRSEQVDVARGMANNYSCQNCCSGNVVGGFIMPAVPGGGALEVNSSRQYLAYETSETCYNYPYSYDTETRAVYPGIVTWNTSNSSIATVSAGNVTGTGAGNVTISANWTAPRIMTMPACGGGGELPLTEEQEDKECATEEADKTQETTAITTRAPITATTVKDDESGDTSDLAACGTCYRQGSRYVYGSAPLTVKPLIKILRDGSDITSTTQNSNTQTVSVGQRINLTAQIIGGSPSTQSWDVPEKRIKDFETLPAGRLANTGRIVPLTDLTSNGVNFIWYEGEYNGMQKQVSFTATVNGISGSAQANFSVKKPTVDLTMTAQPTFIGTATIGGATHWVVTLANATGTVQGATFNRQNTNIPSPFSGEFQFVQLANYSLNGSYTNTTTSTPIPINQSESGLDGCYPYGLNDTTVVDKPALTLDTPNFVFHNVSVSNAWSMFLMFKPSGTDSEWVPLKKLDWSWAYTATRAANGTYTISGVTNPAGSASGADTTTYPLWTYRVPDRSGDNCTSFAPLNFQLQVEEK